MLHQLDVQIPDVHGDIFANQLVGVQQDRLVPAPSPRVGNGHRGRVVPSARSAR